MKEKCRQIALFSVLLGGVLIFVPATAAQAAPMASVDAVAVSSTSLVSDLTVEDILRLNPRAKQVGPGLIQIAEGINLLMPRQTKAGDAEPMVTSGCNWSTGHLCVWEHASYAGYGLDFYFCGADDVNLGYLRYPDGAQMSTYVPGQRWNDRISSMNNHQTTGTRANFYNWEGHWQLAFWTYAPDRRTNLAIDKRMDNGGRINDIIDRVDPC
jgi:hypothetical protein